MDSIVGGGAPVLLLFTGETFEALSEAGTAGSQSV